MRGVWRLSFSILFFAGVASADCSDFSPRPIGAMTRLSGSSSGDVDICAGETWAKLTSTIQTGSCSATPNMIVYNSTAKQFQTCVLGTLASIDLDTGTSLACPVEGAMQFKSDLLTTSLDSGVSPMRWDSFAAGAGHTCGIRQGDRRLFCWGKNDSGQLGTGSFSGNWTWPVQLQNSWQSLPWKTVTAGNYHTCAIRQDNGAMYCWGMASSFRLGNGNNTDDKNIPQQIGSSSSWLQVASSAIHTCAIDSTQSLYCWGGSFPSVPTQYGSGQSWQKVATGVDHVCAIDTSGALYCWGGNDGGQLGDGTTTARSSPTAISSSPVANGNWTELSLGNGHTCALKTDGNLYCWGKNTSGKLGLNKDPASYDKFLTPQLVTSGTGSQWASVSVRNDYSCGLDLAGSMLCWGSNAAGQLGITGYSQLLAPLRVGNTNQSAAKIVAGFWHACLIQNTANSTMKCWGAGGGNSSGQLGNGTTDFSSTVSTVIAGKLRFCIPDGSAQLRWTQLGP